MEKLLHKNLQHTNFNIGG